MKNKIHETAIIDDSAIIGSNVNIGPYTIIHANVRIGNDTSIESHCVFSVSYTHLTLPTTD